MNRDCITDDEVASILGDASSHANCIGEEDCTFATRASYPKSLFWRWRLQISVRSILLIMTSTTVLCTLLKRYGAVSPPDAPGAYFFFVCAFVIPCTCLGGDVYRNRFAGMSGGAVVGVVLAHAAMSLLWIRLIWW